MRVNLATAQTTSYISKCPISFEKVFDVRKIEHLYCPVCASTMFTKNQCCDFCRDLADATGEELVKAIGKYENINNDDEFSKDLPVFNTRQQKILDKIKITALKNEDLYLDDIVEILGREVAQKYATSSTKKILSSYTSVYKDSRPILSDEDYADVFFLNCMNRHYSSYEIAQEFIRHKYPTIEHLVPASKNGIDADINYICDCAECNINRGSMPFDLWASQIPNFDENLQLQINQINRALSESALDSKYKYYPHRVRKTLYSLSNGAINLVV